MIEELELATADTIRKYMLSEFSKRLGMSDDEAEDEDVKPKKRVKQPEVIGSYYDKTTIDDLSFILSKAFCYRNAYEACKRYNEIKDKLVLEDRQALYCTLSELYCNRDSCYDGVAHKDDCKWLSDIIKRIKSRNSPTEKLTNGYIYDDIVQYAEKYGYDIHVNEDFVNGYIDSMIREKYHRICEKWAHFAEQEA